MRRGGARWGGGRGGAHPEHSRLGTRQGLFSRMEASASPRALVVSSGLQEEPEGASGRGMFCPTSASAHFLLPPAAGLRAVLSDSARVAHGGGH